MKIDGKDFSAYFDRRGNLKKITSEDGVFKNRIGYTLYEIDGEIASVSETSSENGLSIKLATQKASGTLTISPGNEIGIHVDMDKDNVAQNTSIVVPFPLETEFHIAESYNLGRKIDKDMPVRKWYSRMLGYNFFLVKFRDIWIRFMTKQSAKRYLTLQISRHPNLFIVTYTWNIMEDSFIGVFSSMHAAMADYEYWLARELNALGFRKLRDDPNVPEWVHNVKLVLFVDMMRSYGEIAHDYDDVVNLARDLEKVGCPKDTLLYIPGSNGPYDSNYPNHGPHPELGGEEKFKERHISFLYRSF